MKRVVLLPLILCISTPQYLILSIDQGFHLYKFGENSNFVWPVVAITVGILLSFILNKYVMGTFLLLGIGVLVFILGGVELLFGSINDSLSHSYLYGLLLTCFAIGLVQHNLAAVFGDQFISSGLNHFGMYVFINMIGICFSRIVSVLLELKQFFGINCLKVDCFTCIHMMCLILSGIGLGILILMFIARKYYVVRIVLHKPVMDSESERFQIYCSIFMPLIGFLIIVFQLEREMLIRANELNRNISDIFSIEHFQLHILYYLLTVLCVPATLLVQVRNPKSFKPIVIGCSLICLANFYIGLLNWYNKKSYNVLNHIPVDPTKTTLQFINGMSDANFDIDPLNIVGYLPYSEKLGPFQYKSSKNINLKINLYVTYPDHIPKVNFSALNVNVSALSTPFINGRLVTLLMGYDHYHYYLERTYRAPSGYALFRFWCNDKFNQHCYENMCLRSIRIVLCHFRSFNSIIEIPADLYNLTIFNVTLATLLLGSGSYNLYYFDCDRVQIGTRQCSICVNLIPPFQLTVHWQLVLYILLSVAKGMIYSAGLHISYFVGSDNQKSLYIGCLYLFYLAAWILYLTFEDFVGFFANELRNGLTVLLLGGTFFFHFNYRYRSHLLSRIKSDGNKL